MGHSPLPATSIRRLLPAVLGAYWILLTPGVVNAAQMTWVDDDWSCGQYSQIWAVDPEVHPGLIVLQNRLDDMRFLASPTAFQGLYCLEVYHDTLFIAASDYPYMYDGAEVISYDYLTDNFEVCYEPYESGLHIIKQFGDSLYIPGPDSMDPWDEEGSIYVYTGYEWIEKATLPRAVHVNDVDIVNGITYASTGQWGGELHGAGCVWISYDYGDSFTCTLVVPPSAGHSARRIFGIGHYGDLVFAQPDGFPPETEVLYTTTDGIDWDTLAVPGLPIDRQAMFTDWGDSLLMTIENKMFIWDGEDWTRYTLPFHGWRWCRGIHEYKGDLYGGGFDCTLYRWIQESDWELVGEMAVDPETEDIESMETYYGRLYVSTSRLDQGDEGRLYVSAAAPIGKLTSLAHDFGTGSQNGVLSWEAFEPDTSAQVRLRLRSAHTPSELESSQFLGPDGTPYTYYEEPGTALPFAHFGHRYFQYSVELVSRDGLHMPFVDEVTLEVDSVDMADVSPGPYGDPFEPGHGRRDLRVSLGPPCPNPACGSIDFQIEVEHPGYIRASGSTAPAAPRLSVLDLQGRLVRSARLRVAAEGPITWRWDLRDQNGNPVPEGVYFARLEVGPKLTTRKIVVPR